MAPRGPKPKPTQLKVMTGTARNHRLNPAEPKIEPAVPDAPDHLSDEAHAEWMRVTGEMAQTGILSSLDRGALAAYAQAYGRWVAAERALSVMAARDAVTADRHLLIGVVFTLASLARSYLLRRLFERYGRGRG